MPRDPACPQGADVLERALYMPTLHARKPDVRLKLASTKARRDAMFVCLNAIF
jgi:hypothetical protein